MDIPVRLKMLISFFLHWWIKVFNKTLYTYLKKEWVLLLLFLHFTNAVMHTVCIVDCLLYAKMQSTVEKVGLISISAS